jgi:Zn-dependent protease with chaperone function
VPPVRTSSKKVLVVHSKEANQNLEVFDDLLQIFFYELSIITFLSKLSTMSSRLLSKQCQQKLFSKSSGLRGSRLQTSVAPVGNNLPSSQLSKRMINYNLVINSSKQRIMSQPFLLCRQSRLFSKTLTPFSSNPTTVTSRALNETTQEKRRRYWKHIANAIKYTRIPVLIISVYSLGYSAGISEYSRSPSKFKQLAFTTVLNSVGCSSSDQVRIAIQGQNSWKAQIMSNTMQSEMNNGYGPGSNRDIQLMNVVYISEKILNSAKQLVLEELNKVTTVDGKVTDQESFERWMTALESLDTEGEERWKFVLLDVNIPNAFVSETTPYTIYVTTAMLEEIVRNDDELALILGHELSHLLLAHNTKSMILERNLRATEVVSKQ